MQVRRVDKPLIYSRFQAFYYFTHNPEVAGSSPVSATIVSVHNTSEHSLFFFTFPHR